MRKMAIALAALILVSLAAPAWAQTKPGVGASTAPGSEPAQPPDAGSNIFPGDVHITVDGETVQQVPAGRAARITLDVVNNGTEAVQNVTAHIEAYEGATVGDADATVGDIAKDGSEPARFTVTATEDPCRDFAAFLITFTFTGGTTQSKFGIPIACPGPRLNVERVLFTGGDGDGVPEPGETIRAFIELTNTGRDAATNVTAHVTVSGKGFTTVTDDLAWNDIAPGEIAKSTTPIVIDIPKDAPRQDPCPPMNFGVTPSGTVPPDTTVSSDGSSGGSGTASDGNVSSSATGAPEPAPDQSNGAVEIQPAPAGSVSPEPPATATDEPAPAPSASDEPLPAPAPGTVEPEPAPDQPVGMEMTLAVKATGYSESMGYGNGIACAVEAFGTKGGAPALGAAPAQQRSRDSALAAEKTGSTSGAAAATVGVAAAFAFAAVVVRRLFAA